MTVSRLITTAILLACTAGHAKAADDSAIGLKPGEGGLQLKLQPSLIRIPPDNKDQVPLFVDADNIQGHQDQETEAEGAVRLRRRGKAFFADWLRYDKPEDEINAHGNVRLEQRGDVLEGTKLKYTVDTERGAMEKPKYRVRVSATTGRGEGDRLLFEGQGKYRLLRGNYTSCDVGNDDWFLRAKDFEIDQGRQVGTARNASVLFLGAPILYSPYLSFSMDRQRKSGFLAPSFGTSGNSGTEFSLPYYWNIAPNRDATITPRVMAKRGVELQNEFRYIDPQYRGEFHFEVLPDDRVKNGDTRSSLSWIHSQSFSNGWNGALNVQKVSDATFFTDLSTQIAATSQTVLPRTGSLAKGGTWWNDGTWGVSTSIQRWQTLQADPLNPITPPYNNAQLNFTANKFNAGFTDFAFSGNFSDFTHPTLINGQRTVAYPAVSVPLQTSFGYLTPKIGLHLTHYNFDQTNTSVPDQNRAVPIFSTETGVVFERNMSWSSQNMVQTIEPKLYYVYIPTRNQNQIPLFDTGLQDINFATLYAENQFSGSDRINDANQVTMGVTSRLLQQANGIERLRVGLAQRYYLKTQDVTLPGVAPRGSNSSDLLAALSATVVPHWSADAGWQYTTNFSQTQRLSVGTRYQPEPGKVLNLSYRYVNGGVITSTGQTQTVVNAINPSNTLRQLDISGQWPVKGRLSVVARWNYSTADSRLLEGLAGLEYDGGCWAFRVLAHSYATTATTSVSSLFMQLELNGVSKIGSNPLELLRRNVGGYYRAGPVPARPEDPFPAH